ncbi:ATP-binding protein [Sphingomonas sp. G124]|uniref:histidine kinase n=1 Tax=Sphingomonas cremea TaxID=2904799 RepID=A0A9X1QL83_9SPHN|nr:ATP-binding protein [Sphingomonas cremea]MCF2515746.1 ATP-binding protein [Sphingomonas cremea]
MYPDALALAVLDAIEDPALIVERGAVTAANQAARQLLGGQMIGRDLRFAIRHPLALDTILAARDAEVDLIGIGGAADRPWSLIVRRLAPDLVLARLADRSALRGAERMRTDFVANASHELRTPLATIIGYAETLAEEGPIDETMRTRFGSTIEAEARRMLRIVEDLMSLSRIEADRFRAPDDNVDMGEVARIAIENAAPLLERRDCKIEAQIQPGIPQISGDFGQLLQLADNLIGNAIRYGCNDISRSVEVTVRADGSRVQLAVGDQGDGIAPDHLPRLTERFYRIDPARSRESGGTGLGLAIVKHIVERHRGTLDIDSAPGRGTKVSVSLPIA